MNHVVQKGYLGRDPETKTTSKGSVTTVSLAVNQPGDRPTMWLQLEAWHNDRAYSAGAALAGLRKGDGVIVSGSLGMDSWDDRETGEKRERTKIIVANVAKTERIELDAAPAAPAAPERHVGARPTGRRAPAPAPRGEDVPF